MAFPRGIYPDHECKVSIREVPCNLSQTTQRPQGVVHLLRNREERVRSDLHDMPHFHDVRHPAYGSVSQVFDFARLRPCSDPLLKGF